MKEIDWSKQHCGVHQATYEQLIELMPDLEELIDSFPMFPQDFIWDVKVHMLMPGQFPCIPNWHFDNIPRVHNKQDFDLIQPDKPMYVWLSGPPYTEFKKGSPSVHWFVKPKEWTKFSQLDEHRGHKSEEFCWRGFIRATHKDIAPPRKENHDPYRRHCQVYLDAESFMW